MFKARPGRPPVPTTSPAKLRKRLLGAALIAFSLVLGFMLPAQAAVSPNLVDTAQSNGMYDVGGQFIDRTYSGRTVDVNNDGVNDLSISFHQRADAKVYQGLGGNTFSWAYRDSGLWPLSKKGVKNLDRHDGEWADFDQNGLMDVYYSGGRNEENYVKNTVNDNELLMQGFAQIGGVVTETERLGDFADIGTVMGVGDKCGRGRYVDSADFNGDGWLDIALGNQIGRPEADPECDSDVKSERPKIFINLGRAASTGKWMGFTASAQWNTIGGISDGMFMNNSGAGCMVALDWNGDGRSDLLTCTFATSNVFLYQNMGNGMRLVPFSTHKLRKMTDARWVDINGDSVKDLVYAAKEGTFYKLGLPAGGFGPEALINASPNPLKVWAIGVDVVDINGDGVVDIYSLMGVAKEVGETDTTVPPNPADFVSVSNGTALSYTLHEAPSMGGKADYVVGYQATPGEPGGFAVLNGLGKLFGNNLNFVVWRNSGS